MADVQIAIVEGRDAQLAITDESGTQIAVVEDRDTQITLAVPGIQGPPGSSGAGTVTIGTNAADVLSAAAGEITADDAAADKLVFWDDSAGKLTYLAIGTNLTITDTTIDATGGVGGGVDPVIAGMIF
jgi:hypothetical protein